MGAMASQITSLTSVYSTIYSDADRRKHQSYVSLAFVRGIHLWPVNSPHKWPVTRKMFPFDDVIMKVEAWSFTAHCVSHRQLYCFFNNLARLTRKKTSNLRSNGRLRVETTSHHKCGKRISMSTSRHDGMQFSFHQWHCSENDTGGYIQVCGFMFQCVLILNKLRISTISWKSL